MSPKITGLTITDNSITIDYTPDPPDPPDPPSGGGGRCISNNAQYKDSLCDTDCNLIQWCPNGCNKDCCETNVIGQGFCKWEYSDPCTGSINPCKNDGICNSIKNENGTYSISCNCKNATGCYKNSTGSSCEIAMVNTGCDGGTGCTINSSCTGTCDKCYNVSDTGKKCDFCSTLEPCTNNLLPGCVNNTCKCVRGLPKKVLIGYWGTNSSPPLINAIETGKYNVIMFTFGKLTSDGQFIWDNSLFHHPSDDEITYLKNNNIPTFISLFGGAGGAPEDYSTTSTEWATSIINSIKTQYDWINGIDIDLEDSWGGSDKTTEYIYALIVEAKKQKYYTSMAPQTTSLDPSVKYFVLNNGGDNAYYPFLTGANINNWDLICPQLYNNEYAGGNDVSSALKYGNSLLNKSTFKCPTTYIKKSLWENGLINGNFEIQIPPEKLVLGFPASGCACHNNFACKIAGSTFNTCGADYKTIEEVKEIYNTLNLRGIMTWSIGWDYIQADPYKFSKGISTFLNP